MASLRKRGGVWYFRFTDHEGDRIEKRGCSDKRATEQMAAHAEAETAKVRAGLVDARALAMAAHGKAPLSQHLDAWRSDLTARGNVPRYVQIAYGHAKRIIERTGARRIAELTPSAVQSALRALHHDEGLSLQTCNHALRAVKGFTRWLVRDGRAPADGLTHLRAFNVKTDRRHDRRALTVDDLQRLIRAAETGPAVMKMSGQDRAMLYRAALGTGYRAGELRSLTPESFALDADPPTIAVRAGYSKRRRDDTQPIRADLADALRPWLAHKAPGLPVFALPEKTARMMRVDLEAAGIAYRDGSDRVADFHSLRHSYVSALARTSAPVKVVQELARHSTPVLTFGVYAHAALHDTTAALDGLPATDTPTRGPEAPALPATGTDGAHISKRFAPYLPHGGGGTWRIVAHLLT